MTLDKYKDKDEVELKGLGMLFLGVALGILLSVGFYYSFINTPTKDFINEIRKDD